MSQSPTSLRNSSRPRREHDRPAAGLAPCPFQKEAFEDYARNWGQAIPRCGADLIGYFAPHEGSATTACGVYTVDSLAAYEAYRARLAADPPGRQNYAFARARRFILREDRIFLKLVSAPHAERIEP